MKKELTKIILIMALLAVMFPGIPAQAKTHRNIVRVEKSIKKKYKRIKILNGNDSEKFWYKIEHRKGKSFYYVEKIVGTVKNVKTGDGDSSRGYTNYSRVKDIKKGSKIMTWFVYSRTNNAWDDIIQRYDIIIKR